MHENRHLCTKHMQRNVYEHSGRYQNSYTKRVTTSHAVENLGISCTKYCICERQTALNAEYPFHRNQIPCFWRLPNVRTYAVPRKTETHVLCMQENWQISTEYNIIKLAPIHSDYCGIEWLFCLSLANCLVLNSSFWFHIICCWNTLCKSHVICYINF